MAYKARSKRNTGPRDPTTRKARDDTWRAPYIPMVLENAALETYYNRIIPVEEQETFWNSLRTPLPATFRVVSTPDTNPFLSQLASDTPIRRLVEPIPFIKRGWKIPEVSRKELKKTPEYQHLYNWLTQGTEAGAICRQEAVSMIPPLLLNIDDPAYRVLDMCAAPGSKTGQLLEYLAEATQDSGGLTGMVVANDADRDRAFMLHHQVRRLHSPCLLVTNNDASKFPTLKVQAAATEKQEKILFDRILCDVPCSGDGTLRKTPSIWKTWSVNQSFGLHSLQRRILERGVQLLAIGGRLVYSTCSLNPIEDEAVVAAVLSKYKEEVRLVDVSSQLPELKRSKGITTWPVMSADQTFHSSASGRLLDSYFPPSNPEWMKLEYTFRVLPHHQDTGGFYLAVFERFQGPGACAHTGVSTGTGTCASAELGAAPDPRSEEDIDTKDKKEEKKSRFHHHLDDFHVLPPDSSAVQSCLAWYYPTSTLPGAFLTRSQDHSSSAPRSMIYCTQSVASVVNSGMHKLAIVNAGVRAFERYEPSAKHADDSYECQYRMLSELLTAAPGFSTLEVDLGLFTELLGTDNTVKVPGVTGWKAGGSVLRLQGKGQMMMAVWRTGDGFVRPFISKQDRPALLQLLQG